MATCGRDDPVAKGCPSIPKYTPTAGYLVACEIQGICATKLDGKLVCAKALCVCEGLVCTRALCVCESLACEGVVFGMRCLLKLLAGPDFLIKASVVWVCLQKGFELSGEKANGALGGARRHFLQA